MKKIHTFFIIVKKMSISHQIFLTAFYQILLNIYKCEFVKMSRQKNKTFVSEQIKF